MCSDCGESACNPSHPCYKCDGGCGKVMGAGSNDDCQRTCDECGGDSSSSDEDVPGPYWTVVGNPDSLSNSPECVDIVSNYEEGTKGPLDFFVSAHVMLDPNPKLEGLIESSVTCVFNVLFGPCGTEKSISVGVDRINGRLRVHTSIPEELSNKAFLSSKAFQAATSTGEPSSEVCLWIFSLCFLLALFFCLFYCLFVFFLFVYYYVFKRRSLTTSPLPILRRCGFPTAWEIFSCLRY